MNYLKTRLNTISFYVLCTSIFLLRLPPFSFFSSSPLFNTHSIARGLLMLLIVSVIYLVPKKTLSYKLDKKIIAVVLFYFLMNSISIFGATNISAFFSTYKDIFFGILLYFICFSLVKTKKNIIFILSILISTILFDLVYQFLIYFHLSLFKSLIEPFIYSKYLLVLNLNTLRNKYFIDVYDAALIPIVFCFLTRKNKLVLNLLALVTVIFVSFFAFVSNFRIHIMMLVFSLLGTSLVVLKSISKRLIFICAAILVLLLIYIGLFSSNTSSTIDRIVSPQDLDYQSITSRVKLWNASVEMGLSSPLLGVGLGNFYDALPFNKTVTTSLIDPHNQLAQATYNHPHNIFFQALGETGLGGLLSTILLIGLFAYIDFKQYLKDERGVKLLIVSFWSLFSFALLAPPNTTQYISLFWLLRALIGRLTLLN